MISIYYNAEKETDIKIVTARLLHQNIIFYQRPTMESQQTAGVTMGSPLGLTRANIMTALEET